MTFWNIFIFPRKQDLTFHANCLKWRQFAWNVKSCAGKNKKNVTNFLFAELTQRVVKLKSFQKWELFRSNILPFKGSPLWGGKYFYELFPSKFYPYSLNFTKVIYYGCQHQRHWTALCACASWFSWYYSNIFLVFIGNRACHILDTCNEKRHLTMYVVTT